MTEHDELVEDLVFQCLQALGSRDPGAVDALLAPHDGDTRRVVQEMLATLTRVGLAGDAAPDEAPGRLGPYQLLERIGAGAMGIVYRARGDDGRDRALKVLQPGLLPQRRARLRFEREIQALRELDHPGICPILDAGEIDGVPFLVMPLIAGDSLRAAFARGPTSDHDARRRLLDVIERLARSLHHAHERGFVHRDVKPANVMLQPDGQPVVLDFGLARIDQAADGTSPSMSREIVGAPAYMAPEQITDARNVDRRCDVYALGALLYEGLTGRCPYEAATRESLYRLILTGDVRGPSRRRSGVPADLDVVCLTALARDADHRYQTAAAFADDVARVRDGRRPQARLPGPLERARRWIRRHPLPSALLVSLTLALAGVVALALHVQRSSRRDAALALVAESFAVLPADPDRALERALASHRMDPDAIESLAAIQAARAAEREERVLTGHTLPVVHLEFAPDGELLVSVSLDGTARLWDLRSGQHLELQHDDDGPVLATFQPRGGLVVTAGRTGTIRAFDARTRSLLWQRQASRPGSALRVLRWSPDGAHLLTGGDGKAQLWTITGEERVLATTDDAVTAGVWIDEARVVLGTGRASGSDGGGPFWLRELQFDADEVHELAAHAHDQPIVALHPRPGSKEPLLVVPHERTAYLWDRGGNTWTALDGELTREIVDGCWSADGQSVLVAAPGGRIASWVYPLRKPEAPEADHKPSIMDRVAAVVAHPRLPLFFACGGLGRASLHNFEGFVVRSFGKGRLRARPIALSADGRRLATTSWDHSIAIWSLWNPELPVFLDGDRVLGADWMADGRTVVTGSGKRVGVDDMSGVVRTWDVATGELVGRPLVVARQVMKVLRNPQAGALLALHGRGWDGSAQLLGGAAGDWHLDGEPLSGAPLTEFPWDAQFLDGERVLLGDAGGALLIWSLTDRIVTHCLPIVPPDAGPAGNGRLLGVCATRDGSTLWAGGTPGFLHRFDRQGDGSYREAPVTPIGECINVLRLLPDGTLLLGLSNGRLQRRSAAGSDLLVAFEGHTADVRAIDWTMADGKLLIASADWSGRVRLWREDGTPIREIRAHEDVIWSVRFSPEGDRLLTACADGTARIWPVRLQIGR